MKIATNKKVEWKKPKGTEIHRLAEGCEDSLFASYFTGWYKKQINEAFANSDAGMDKIDIDLKVKAKQDIGKIANQHMEAAAMLKSKISDNYTIETYFVSHDYKEMIKITDQKEFGRFFADEVYIVDIKSDQHQYLTTWEGRNINPGDRAKIRELMNKHCNYEISSNQTRTYISKA